MRSIFDDDNSGTVEYRELIMGLEIFKEGSFEDKLKVFFDLCDNDGSGHISQKELYDVFKLNCITSDEKSRLKKIIKEIFIFADKNGDGELDRDELFGAAKVNSTLKNLLEESIKSVKKVDKIIENDLEEHFHTWIPMSSNLVKYKEGIHFPMMERVLKMVEENEELVSEMKKQKMQFYADSRKNNLYRDDQSDEYDEYDEVYK